MISVIATMHPAAGRRDEFLKAMVPFVSEVLAEQGCAAYVPHTVGREGIVIIEAWDNVEALKAHGKGQAMANLNAATEHLIASPPDIVVAHPVEPATES